MEHYSNSSSIHKEMYVENKKKWLRIDEILIIVRLLSTQPTIQFLMVGITLNITNNLT